MYYIPELQVLPLIQLNRKFDMELQRENHHPALQAVRSGFDRQVDRIDSITLNNWIQSSAAFLIDVREAHNFEESRIPGSFLVPMSRFEAATFRGRRINRPFG